MLAVRTWNLVVFLSTIAIITFVGVCVLALWLIWEMGKAKGVLNEIRSMDAKKDAVKGAEKDAEKDAEKTETIDDLEKLIKEYHKMDKTCRGRFKEWCRKPWTFCQLIKQCKGTRKVDCERG